MSSRQNELAISASGLSADLVRPFNPCQAFIRRFRSSAQAMKFLKSVPSVGSVERPLLLPTQMHGDLLKDLADAVYEGYEHRNLGTQDFRTVTIEALSAASSRADFSGYMIPAWKVAVDGSEGRGFFAIMPSGTGRRTTAKAIAAYFGELVRAVRVEAPDNPGRFSNFLQIPALRVQWPTNGSLALFCSSIAQRIDAMLGDANVVLNKGPLRQRYEEKTMAMISLAIAYNVGVLIVERINTGPADTAQAKHLWDALATFTCETGVPVVCFATAGGQAALSKHPSALGALSGRGEYSFAAPRATSGGWKAFCDYLFRTYIAVKHEECAEAWFYSALHGATRARYSSAIKLCRYIHSERQESDAGELRQDELFSYADEALLLEAPHFHALDEVAKASGPYATPSIRAHGDWLPSAAVMKTVPRLRLEKAADSK